MQLFCHALHQQAMPACLQQPEHVANEASGLPFQASPQPSPTDIDAGEASHQQLGFLHAEVVKYGCCNIRSNSTDAAIRTHLWQLLQADHIVVNPHPRKVATEDLHCVQLNGQ